MSIQKIAEYYLSGNNLDKARHLYDTLLLMDKQSINHEPTMFGYEGLGNIAMRQADYINAIQFYKRSLQYAREKKFHFNAEYLNIQLGRAFLANGEKDSSVYYLQLAIDQSAKNKNFSNLSQAYEVMSALQKKQKKYAESLAAFEMYKNYNDSLVTIEKVRAVNNLEILYRTRQKENEILLLQKTDQEKDFAIKKRNIYIGIGTVLIGVMCLILFLLRYNYKNKQHLQDEKVKQLEQQQQVASLQSMINGQEAERTRIAKDLHDGLGGLFSTVKMYFSTLEHENEKLRSDELFRKSYALVDNASVELRRIAHNMMPEVLGKMGLINAVKDLADNISAGRIIKVSMEVHGMHKRFNVNTEIMLYRIIQELLNNIIRHAYATETIIQFIKDDNRLSVVVEDNGKGFNLKERDETIHTGIETIKSRVHYLNGKLTIDTQKDMGTTIMMDFLIDEDGSIVNLA